MLDIQAIIRRAREEILADMEAGTVPKSVRTFAALHDYVDANGYGGFLEMGDDVDGEAMIVAAELVQAFLDEWLRLRRPEGEVFIRNVGDSCEHPAGTSGLKVIVRFRNKTETTEPCPAENIDWDHYGQPSDVMSWRFAA